MENPLDLFKIVESEKGCELRCSYSRITSFKGINAPRVTSLACTGSKLTSFEGLIASQLTTACCSENLITTVELNAPLLTTLLISGNKLTSLVGLVAPRLSMMYCSKNNLTSLAGFIAPMLTTLDCLKNNIMSLEGLHFPLLTRLSCSGNFIRSLEGFVAPMLNILDCSYNSLTSLEGLIAPLLTSLNCSGNHLRSLVGLNAPLLTKLNCSENPIEYIPPYIIRLLNRAKNNQQVYSDGQNVHNHNIQECIRQSIQRILCEKPTVVDIYETVCSDEILTVGTKEILIQYMNNPEVHSTLNITFKELLEHVWSRIMSNEHASEIKVILNEEMKDSLCKCFTGCLSRLINCLNGMDELVSIKISDTEQIGNIIGLIKEKLENKKEYTIERHREEVRIELEERGYSEEVIVEWISYIE